MEVALKQRLVGASVIIALAVIFIPMLFDNSRTSHNQSISIDIPDEPEGLKRKVVNIDTGQFTDNKETNKNTESNDKQNESLNSESLPIPNKDNIIDKQETIIDMVDNSIDRPISNNNDTAPIENNDTTNNQSEIPITEDTQDNMPSSNDKENVLNNTTKIPVKQPEINDNDFPSTHRIKYGVFSQQKNAQQLKAKIINSGHDAIVEKDNESNMYTVFSKEFSSEYEAQKISDTIQKLNLNIGKPSILSFDELNRDAAEFMLDTGWIIQIGSFASKVNSIKLRDKIRNKGFVSFVDEITNSKKQQRYRVRIGPYATRDEAESEQNKINNAIQLKGLIKPHEKQKVVIK